MQGIQVEDRAYAGGWWDWLTPFSILTGRGAGRRLRAARRDLAGDEDRWARCRTGRARIALAAGVGTLALIGGVSLWTPFLEPLYFERWFAWPTVIFSGLVPVLIAALRLGCSVTGLRQRPATGGPSSAARPSSCSASSGIGISFYPYIVPPALTIEEAAAPDDSLVFLLVGAAILVPIILAYTAYSYWVFRGKVGHDEGYH